MADHSSDVVQRHVPCTNPACGSSDGMDVFDDGHTYCYACQTYTHGTGDTNTRQKEQKTKVAKDLIPLDSLTLSPIKARGLTEETCRRFGYYIAEDKGQMVQVACHYDNSGAMIAQKVRTKDKKFWMNGDHLDRFVGQHLCVGGGKRLVITEGEIDMLTASQVQQHKWPVVSLPLGSQSAAKTFKAQVEFLDSFEEVVTMFDMDGPGEEARKAVEGILPPGKLKHAYLPMKDPNEVFLAGKADEILKAIWNAKVYKPDGIINGQDLWDELENEEDTTMGDPWAWDIDLNDMTLGTREGELVMITAGTGVGKTTFVRQCAHHLGVTLGKKVGLMMLEENKKRTAKGLMSIQAGKRLHINRKAITPEQYRQYFLETIGNGNFVVYDHFGSTEGDNLLNKMRYMVTAEGCRYIILDHITIAISGLEGDNERKMIDKLMTHMRSLCEETGCGIFVISHLTKTKGGQDDGTHETGRVITLDDLRGSGSLKQIPDTVVALERNQQAEGDDKNLTKVRILKCRWTGETGLAGYLRYDKETARLMAAVAADDTAAGCVDLGRDGDKDF